MSSMASNSSLPLVSIMIISYNQQRYIEETVRSALDQDYENLEVVVSDDGSTDGTVGILKLLSKEYGDRLRLLVDNKNVGITRNSNRGLFACNGEFIAFQGGDDILLPGKISAQVKWFLDREERVICVHDVEVFDSLSNKTICFYRDIAPLVSGYGPDRVISTLKLGAATSTMVRRTAVPDWGFDERLPVVSDCKLWIDVLSQGGEYGFIDGVYARYRRHGGNSRLKFPDQHRADCYTTMALSLSSYPEYAGSIRRGYAYVVALHAISEGFAGRRLIALRLLLLSQRNSFWQIKPVFGVLYACLPKQVQGVLTRLLSRLVPELRYIQS